MPQYIQIDEIRRQPVDPKRLALWDLGFRPFYLLASGFAALSVPLWAAQFAGWLGTPALPGTLGHAHEMIHGFALAVITGFLFTAARNWSGQPTPTGVHLMVLAGIWLAARLAAFTPWLWTSMVLNVLFALGVAQGLGRALLRGENRRNDFFVLVLLAMGAGSLAIHLARLGSWPLPGEHGVQCALDLVLFVVVVMAGRVIPMFTNNAIAGANAGRRAWLDRLALGATLAVLASDLASTNVWLRCACLGVACAAHVMRWLLWRPWRTLAHPLVWVLHLAYLWVPVHLAMRLAAGVAPLGMAGAPAQSLAIHALTVGAIGGMIVGMMIRTTRGHTGLALRADAFDVSAIALVNLAALLRVLLPWLAPGATLAAILASSLAWALAFAVYAWRYGPALCRPRADGQAG